MTSQKISIREALVSDLSVVARDMSSLMGRYVSVQEVAEMFLMEKLSQLKAKRASSKGAAIPYPNREETDLPKLPTLLDDARKIAQELEQSLHGTVGPKEAEWVHKVEPVIEGSYAGAQENPQKPLSAEGSSARARSTGEEVLKKDPSYFEDAIPPGFYPGFPMGILEIALKDPFVQPAPSPYYNPDYKLISNPESGQRFLQFNGWRAKIREKNGEVYRMNSEGKPVRVAYRSHRMFPDRAREKVRIKGTGVIVGDGSDGDTTIE